jgi:drug/metabolite transporter (DMT)-like permease
MEEPMAVATTRAALPDRRVLVAFAVFILFLGGASVAIRITYDEVAPFWMATARFGLAALVFWGLVVARKLALPRGRALIGAVLFGALTIGLAFVLIGWGLVETPASVFQVLMALIPLATLFLSRLEGVEAVNRREIIGSVLALGGIALTVSGTGDSGISVPHIVAIIVAAVLVAQGGVVIKKFPPTPPIMTNAIAMTTGTLILATVSLVRGEAWTIPRQTDTWVAFIYLVIFVTVIAFLLYVFVLGQWTASGTSYGFVLVPLVTIVVAAILTDEAITGGFLAGSVLVLAGVYIGALMPSRANHEALRKCHDHAGGVLHRCA